MQHFITIDLYKYGVSYGICILDFFLLVTRSEIFTS